MQFDGHIIGASFMSGDRFVAGRWTRSPLGPFADVMWCRGDGHRVLFAPNEHAGDFVARHYAFDEVRIEAVKIERGAGGAIVAEAGPIHLVLQPRVAGLASRLLAMRPHRLRMSKYWIDIEDRFFRPLLQPLITVTGVHTTGITFAGAREWYAIHDYRDADADASIAGADLGPSAPCGPAGFGFSEFPGGPAMVRVTSIFELVAKADQETLLPRHAR